MTLWTNRANSWSGSSSKLNIFRHGRKIWLTDWNSLPRKYSLWRRFRLPVKILKILAFVMKGLCNLSPWSRCIQRTRMRGTGSIWGQVSRRYMERRAQLQRSQSHVLPSSNSTRVRTIRHMRHLSFMMKTSINIKITPIMRTTIS